MENAFHACKSLDHVRIPSSIKVIGFGAFMFCKHLVSVDLCEGLDCIPDSAFQGCASLERIKIPPLRHMD
jgi:hypothetical protein